MSRDPDSLDHCTCWIHGMHPEATPCPECPEHHSGTCTHPEHAADLAEALDTRRHLDQLATEATR